MSSFFKELGVVHSCHHMVLSFAGLAVGLGISLLVILFMTIPYQTVNGVRVKKLEAWRQIAIVIVMTCTVCAFVCTISLFTTRVFCLKNQNQQ